MDRNVGLIRFVVANNRTLTVVAVVLLGIGGILEGFGIAAALPVLEAMVGAEGSERGALAEGLTTALGAIGITATVNTLLIFLVVMFLIRAVFLYAASITVGFGVARMVMELRLRLIRAITRAEWKHALSYPTGYIANALGSESDRTGMAYAEFTQMVAEGIQVLVYLALVFFISWQTGLAAIAVGGTVLLLFQGRVEASRRAGHDQVNVRRSVLARLTDALPSLKPLKAMGRERYLLPRLEQETHAYFEAQKRELASTELLKKAREPLVMTALAAGLWGVITFSTIGSTSVMILAALFYRSVTSITNMQQRWVSVTVGDHSFRSLMEHIQSAEDARERWVSTGTPPPRLRESLRLDGVSFSYGDAQILRGVDAELQAGTFVTLAGPSGSGKSTLVDLITGLLRPTGGRILIDGIDLSEVDVPEWRKHIGYVPQEPMLFSDSVMNNISLGDPDISVQDVENALRIASAWEFVQNLPNGLDQRIGEGGMQLSGGQRQRLSIARAVVVRPSLLILDEPTTALDTVSESEVGRAISGLRSHLTILAISHQTALRDLADVVWELNGGRIQMTTTSGAEWGTAETASIDMYPASG